jgi:hypothetical protein
MQGMPEQIQALTAGDHVLVHSPSRDVDQGQGGAVPPAIVASRAAGKPPLKGLRDLKPSIRCDR